MNRIGLLCLFLLASTAMVSAASPALPNINTNNILTITGAPYNAVGDGVATNTAAIQSAIAAAALGSTTNGLSGGTVRIPAGTFLSGPITLANNVNIQIDVGAVLRMLPITTYPGGTDSPANFISGSSLHDIEISGFGAIDGQGSPWWRALEANSGISRPNMITLSTCTRVLIQNVTLSNCPSQNMSIKGKAGNVTIDSVTVLAPSSHDPTNPSHNTDAIDLAETNCVIKNCYFNTGDDNVALGSSASASADILITNLMSGNGHGISIGSFTSGGVSNITVVDCSFTNTDQGIRIKSDRDRGGVVQNLNYYNITMSNVQYPILIYCQYTNTTPAYTDLNNLTPEIAASYPSNAVTSKTPIYRNITFSNITGTAQSGRMIGLIWGLPEMSISNITFANVNMSGSKTFGLYSVHGVTFADSQFTTPSGITNISFYNTQVTFTNSVPSSNVVSLNGTVTNTIGSSLRFYNALASLKNTGALAASAGITLADSVFTISNNFIMSNTTVLNYQLDTNTDKLAVVGNLSLGGTVNITNGTGFGSGTYTLMTYMGTLTGPVPTLGTIVSGFNYAFNTNITGQINLSVTPLPSIAPLNIGMQISGGQLNLAWPADHIGWRLQIQTNNGAGLGSNWSDVAGSSVTNLFHIPISPANTGVFLRLVYP